MKKIILTALDNNDEIWYRCFIPFVISLKNTNYQGEIGVISYQLSPEKKQKLIENNILVFDSINRFSSLLIDRQFSTCKIAQDYQYEYIALYDADIWFSYPEFTLFEQINHYENLYCCYDVINPPFLLSSVSLNDQHLIKEKLDNLYQTQQYFWQAGLIVGNSKAWLNYLDYIEQDLNYLTNFKMDYGVDATVLNLYGCDKNKISHLSERFNCLPYWGMRLIDETLPNHFRLNNENIEGIHITRFHRDIKEYNYLYLMQQMYLDQGKHFCLSQEPINHYSQCGYLFHSLNQNIEPALVIEEIQCSYLSANRDQEGICYQKDMLIFDLSATSLIKLTNLDFDIVTFNFLYQARINHNLPIKIESWVNNKELNLNQNKLYLIQLKKNESIVLITDDLWRENCGVRYLFSGVRLI